MTLYDENLKWYHTAVVSVYATQVCVSVLVYLFVFLFIYLYLILIIPHQGKRRIFLNIFLPV